MTFVFGTLGFTPSKLLPTVRNHENVEKLTFYYDRHPKSREAAERVKAFCRERKLAAEGRELDAFDVIASARDIRRDVRQAGADNVVFNVTGGTPVLSCAATLACILEGARAVYIHESTKAEIALPLLNLRYAEVLNPEQRRVLRFVSARGPKGCHQAEIAKALKLSRATVSHHVTNLKKRALVQAIPHAADARRDVLTAQPSASLLLLEDDA